MICVELDVASKKHDCYIMSDIDENSNLLITITTTLGDLLSLKKRFMNSSPT